MGSRDDYSESFYRRHAQRYAEVSHNYIQSVYSNVSHPALTGDADVMDRLTELVPTSSRGLDAGCGAGARDVFLLWQKGYDIHGIDSDRGEHPGGSQDAPRDFTEVIGR